MTGSFLWRDGTGCSFWYWEEDYVDVVAGQRAIVEQGNRRSNAGRLMSGGVGKMDKEAKVVGISNEIFSLVKVIFIVSVCILFVLMMILIV
jgi:hypothetical protein